MSSLDQLRDRSDGSPHRVLAHSQRRLILSILQENEREYAVADLAKEIASRERNCSTANVDLDRARRIQISLYHRHVPLMVEAGLVRFDEDIRVVALADSLR